MNDILFKPHELFHNSLEKQFHEGAISYFEELENKSGINKEANAKHVADYKKSKEEEEAISSKLEKGKSLKVFMIVVIVICFILAFFGLLVGITDNFKWYWILGSILLIGLAIFLIVWIVKKVNKSNAIHEESLKKAKDKSEKLLDQCYEDMQPLNELFDWNIPAKIMEEKTPIIDLDPYFNPKRLDYLKKKFGLRENDDPDSSTLQVLSGNINGNPFVVEKNLCHHYGPKQYTGTLTIHWTTTHTDSEGHVHTDHHTQTLTAHVTHDAPGYWDDTVLIYGNEAAPHLHFHHTKSGAKGMNEKEISKLVKNNMKSIKKLGEEAVSKGKTFTPMGNDDFDALFNAWDRDNEVEFRLLFTPLAQANMLDILKTSDPFGDDFTFKKSGMVNVIRSDHSQIFDYAQSPDNFYHYDLEACKANFISYCDVFIKNLYFDLAPLLSIPLYQMHMPEEFIYEDEYDSNLTSFEHEVMANGMDPDIFRPKTADPDLPLLIKTKKISKEGEVDSVEANVFSYETTPMVDYVNKLGGDGNIHAVPVEWVKYDKVKKKTNFAIANIDCGINDFRKERDNLQKEVSIMRGNYHFERGLLAYFNAKGDVAKENKSFATIFKKEKNA